MSHRCDPCEAAHEASAGWNDGGANPTCAFVNGRFSTNNWNCQTLSRLRELCPVQSFDDNSAGSCAMAWIPEHEEGPGDDGAGFYVVLSFYKNRGCTPQAYRFRDEEFPRPLSLEEAQAAIRELERMKAGGGIYLPGGVG